MAAQRDFILRMIEQIGQMLMGLRHMIAEGSAPAADVDAGLRSAAERAGVDLDLTRAATAETLELILGTTAEADPSRAWVLAELLYLDGLHSESIGGAESARTSFEKAYRLLGLLEPSGARIAGWPGIAERMAELGARLSQDASGPDRTPAEPGPGHDRADA